MEINATDNAKINLSVESEKLTVHANSGTRVEIDGNGEDVLIHASQNAFIKASLNYDTVTITMDHRSDAEIAGVFNNGTVDIKENSHLRAEGLTWDNLTVTARHDSRAEVNVKDDLVINAMDDAEVSIYNSPKITIQQFTGEAVLRKED